MLRSSSLVGREVKRNGTVAATEDGGPIWSKLHRRRVWPGGETMATAFFGWVWIDASIELFGWARDRV